MQCKLAISSHFAGRKCGSQIISIRGGWSLGINCGNENTRYGRRGVIWQSGMTANIKRRLWLGFEPQSLLPNVIDSLRFLTLDILKSMFGGCIENGRQRREAIL
jgi:hypothetical protein